MLLLLALAAPAAVIGLLVDVAITLFHSGIAKDHPRHSERHRGSDLDCDSPRPACVLVAGFVGIAGLAASMLWPQENGRLFVCGWSTRRLRLRSLIPIGH